MIKAKVPMCQSFDNRKKYPKEDKLLSNANQYPEKSYLCNATAYPYQTVPTKFYMLNVIQEAPVFTNVGVVQEGFFLASFYNSLYNYYGVRPMLVFDTYAELEKDILSGEPIPQENYLRGKVWLPFKKATFYEQERLSSLLEERKLNPTGTLFPTSQRIKNKAAPYGQRFTETYYQIYEDEGSFYLFYNAEHYEDKFDFKKTVKNKDGKLVDKWDTKKFDNVFIKMEERELLIDPENKMAIFEDVLFSGIMFQDLDEYFPLFIQGLKDIKRLVERTKTQEHKKTESDERATSETVSSTEFAENQSDTPTSVTNNPTTISISEHSKVAERANDLKKILQALQDERNKLTKELQAYTDKKSKEIAYVDKQIGETIEEITNLAGDLAKDRE